MKRVAAAVVCVAAGVPSGLAIQATSGAKLEAKAVAWLSAHRDAPQQDDLAELRTENPEAYAIVKALLTKRSLGLLDPRHPTASFAAPPPQEAQDGAPQGAAAFQAIAEESGEPQKAAPVYAEAPVSSHHDWMSWKPQQGAMDDEAMVKNVLGAVASLKGGGASAAPALRGSSSSGGEDSAGSLQWENPAPAAPVAQAAPEVPQAESKPPASMSQENSYLKGLGFDGMSSQSQPATAQDNSYLKGLDLGGPDAPAAPAAVPVSVAPVAPEAPKPVVGLSAVKKQAGTDYLSSFSWDDAAPAAPQAHAAQIPAVPGAQAQASVAAAPAASSGSSPKSSALMSWLTGVKPAKKAAAPTQAPAQNSYMMDLD